MEIVLKREYRRFYRNCIEAVKQCGDRAICIVSLFGDIVQSIPADEAVAEKINNMSDELRNKAYNLPYFYVYIINGQDSSNMYCMTHCLYTTRLMRSTGLTKQLSLIVHGNQLYSMEKDSPEYSVRRFDCKQFMTYCLCCSLSVPDKEVYRNHKYTT